MQNSELVVIEKKQDLVQSDIMMKIEDRYNFSWIEPRAWVCKPSRYPEHEFGWTMTMIIHWHIVQFIILLSKILFLCSIFKLLGGY